MNLLSCGRETTRRTKARLHTVFKCQCICMRQRSWKRLNKNEKPTGSENILDCKLKLHNKMKMKITRNERIRFAGTGGMERLLPGFRGENAIKVQNTEGQVVTNVTIFYLANFSLGTRSPTLYSKSDLRVKVPHRCDSMAPPGISTFRLELTRFCLFLSE
jgi:hypothetical protein